LDDSALTQALATGVRALRRMKDRTDLVHEAPRRQARRLTDGQPRVVPITQVPRSSVRRSRMPEHPDGGSAVHASLDAVMGDRDPDRLAGRSIGLARDEGEEGRTDAGWRCPPSSTERQLWTSIVRHGALLLFLAGLPFSCWRRRSVLVAHARGRLLSRPPHRVDDRRLVGMMARFPAAHLNAKAPNEATLHERRRGRDVHPCAHGGQYHD